MKDQILKIAGVKSEKEFYKKYPSEEAFMKAHGKEFKKAKLNNAIPDAQYGCKGKSCTQTGEGMFKIGSRLNGDGGSGYVGGPEIKVVPEWDEISTSKGYFDKDQLKTFEKEFKKNKELQAKYPGITLGQYVAAQRDAARTNTQFAQPDKYSKYFDPKTGSLLPNIDPKSVDPFMRFYREKFPTQSKISAEDVLGVFGGMEGGLSNYEKYANVGYAKPLKEGGQLHKLQQLTDFGNPPIAQFGIPLGANPSGGFDWTMGMNSSISGPYVAGATPVSGLANAGGAGKGFFNQIGGMQGLTNIAGSAIGMVQGINRYKKQKKDLQSQIDVAKVVNRAARLPEERTNRQYLRPEEYAFQQEELNKPKGEGTVYIKNGGNVTKAQSGKMIGGNPTEIQNTYSPGDLYSNLGYEPLSESDIVKQYEEGGFIPMAQGGYSTAGSLGNFLNTFGGGGAGGAGIAGTAGGMIAPALGFANFVIGDIQSRNLDAMANQANQLADSTAMMNVGKGIHSQYSKFMQDGGWVSHDWQPQVITKFGEYDVEDLLAPDPTMDTLRTGGRITQNNMFPQDQYALGGELKTTWGGYAEPISHNPKMPGTGEMVMFRGKSHKESDGNGHTGIGVKYGEGSHDSYTDYAEYGTEQADADVEVEKGEPGQEMVDPKTGEKNLVIWGDLVMNRDVANSIGRPDAEGMKYKNFISKVIAPEENKQNKIKQKVSQLIELNDDGTPFGQLAMSSAKAMEIGADMNLENAAKVKMESADHQEATNKMAGVLGIDAASLAKGKIKLDKEAMKQTAKYGKEIFRAQTGVTYPVYDADGNISYYVDEKGNPINGATTSTNTTVPSTTDANKVAEIKKLYEEAKAEGAGGKKSAKTKKFQEKFHEYFPEFAKEVIISSPKGVTSKGKGKYKTIEQLKKAPIEDILSTNVDEYFGPRTEQYMARLEKSIVPPPPVIQPFNTDLPPSQAQPQPQVPPVIQTAKKKKGFDVLQTINSLLPYFDKPYQEAFDISQIYPELAAISMNKVEPVKAQGVQPLLETPYDISYQDRINEVTASERAAQRMAGQDPAAQAIISSNARRAKDSILAEQFRANQAEKAGVYGRNRATLNQAMLTNLGIYADQEQKQRKVEAITKATFLEALGSMTDKRAKNKLENKKFATLANMFPNYRFTGDMRAVPKGLTLFNAPIVPGATGAVPALATNPYVSGSYTTQQSGKTVAPPTATPSSQAPSASTIAAVSDILGSEYGELPSLESLYADETVYPVEQKYGGKTKKKKTNGSIVKAIKNL